jgi:hypothetical protein
LTKLGIIVGASLLAAFTAVVAIVIISKKITAATAAEVRPETIKISEVKITEFEEMNPQ